MSDQDVFAQPADGDNQQQGDTGTPQNQNPSELDVFADKLSSITNEDGTPKYTDVASALDSIPHAQQHILTLEREAEELRQKLAQEQAAKELLVKSAQPQKPTEQAGLTEEQVAQIALKAQQDALQRQAQQANVDAVNATFSQLYGEKAVAQMQQVAKDSGMSIQQIRDLAQSSPQAVYRLAGINAQPQQTPAPKTPGAGGGDQFTPPKEPVVPKSVMGGSNTKDLVANWHAAGEIVRSQQT